MPRAKFGPGPLKTVVMHKKQRNLHDKQTDSLFFYKICNVMLSELMEKNSL